MPESAAVSWRESFLQKLVSDPSCFPESSDFNKCSERSMQTKHRGRSSHSTAVTTTRLTSSRIFDSLLDRHRRSLSLNKVTSPNRSHEKRERRIFPIHQMQLLVTYQSPRCHEVSTTSR